MFGRGHCRDFEEGNQYRHSFDWSAFRDWRWSRHGHWRQPREEAFSQEEFNILILNFLNEKSSYGFEIIKLIEEITNNSYSPKAETIYPTLTNLEDLGYAKVSIEENGKKIYSITDEGKAYLDENKDLVEKVNKKISDLKSQISGKTITEIYKVLKNIFFIVSDKYRKGDWTNQQLSKLVEILEKTEQEIKNIS